MNREELLQLSYDCVIPSALLFHEKIESNAIKTYAVIRSLAKMPGYCYATNEYLSSVLGICERSIRNHIYSLKKEGFIEIQVDKNGIQWQRKLYISEKFKKMFTKGKNLPPPRQKFATILEEYTIVDSSYCASPLDEGGAASPPAVPSGPSSKAIEASQLFEKKRFELNPYEPPDIPRVAKVFDTLPGFAQGIIPTEEILAVIEHTFESSYWNKVITSVEMFHKKFLSIFKQYTVQKMSVLKEKNKKGNQEISRKILKELKEVSKDEQVYPNERQACQNLLTIMRLDKSNLINIETGEKISLFLEKQEFCAEVTRIFGFTIQV